MPNIVNGFNAEIPLGVTDPVPASIAVTAGITTLAAEGATVQLTVTDTFPDGSQVILTAVETGTNYASSNPAIASVIGDGLVTAASSGTAFISAINEGALGVLRIQVVLSGDTDGDGIPDDLEISVGLNPNDPVDGIKDADVDGLTNKEELVDFGTDHQNADSDDDGIDDGEEVKAGDDGFVTDPLRPDTDGDGIKDKLEVDTGSNPTDPTSFNLAEALASLEVTPSAINLVFNVILGEASRQLTVTGTLVDGIPIDLTSTARGTNYTSSDLNVCNFGADPGQVFAGADGTRTVTVSNSRFSDQVAITVEVFTPMRITSVNIPGYANNVDISGNHAFVAAGSAGLVVVDVSDRSSPVVVAALYTTGNA